MKNLKGQLGQTIIEMVVVAGIMILLLVGIMAVVMSSVAKNKIAKERAVATRLVQEGIEWIRQERDKRMWVDFDNLLGSQSHICLTNVQTMDLDQGDFGECAIGDEADRVVANLGDFSVSYWRELSLIKDESKDRYEILVSVKWTENAREQTASSAAYLYNLE